MTFIYESMEHQPYRWKNVLVTNYTEARRLWELRKHTRSFPDSHPRPLAPNRSIRLLEDGSLACRLRDVDVVTWHPDGTVTIQGSRDQGTPVFVERLTPRSIVRLNKHGVLLLGQHPPTRAAWSTVWEGDAYGRWCRSTQVRVIRSEPGDSIRLKQGPERWEPVDPAQLQPLRWHELDKAKARKLSKEWGFDGFKAWQRAVEKLGGEYTYSYVRPAHYIAECIRAGDYFDAVSGMAHFRAGYYDSALRAWVLRPPKPRPGELRRARNYVYNLEGAVIERSATEVTYNFWYNFVRKNRYAF